MEQKGMTARVCAFSRAYHAEHNKVMIFDDTIAKKLLSEKEFDVISENMSNGISYFNKDFKGGKEEALKWIVDHVLSQTPLARAAFSEEALEASVKKGVMQYLICAAGLDTFSYRQPEWASKLEIFEIDYPATSIEKQERLKRAKIHIPHNVHFVKADFAEEKWKRALEAQSTFDRDRISFCSLLGVIYYLTKEEFSNLIRIIGSILPSGSRIVFDYPNEHYFEKQKKHSELAKASKEAMLACYSLEEMKRELARNNFVICKHLNAEEMTAQYFSDYNQVNQNDPILAQENVNYCLAERRTIL